MADKPSKTLDEAVAQLTRDTVDNPAHSFTYSYLASARSGLDGNPFGEMTSSFQQLTATQITFMESAIDRWEEVANITFVRQYGPNGEEYSNSGTIGIQNYTKAKTGSGGFAWYGDILGLNNDQDSGDSNGQVDNVTGWSDITSPTIGSSIYEQIYIHEVGHLLGLAHPGDYDSSSGDPITYDDDAIYREDSRLYTVMSYFGPAEPDFPPGVPSASWQRAAATPMLHDIAAAQALYGANMSTRTGNTIYGFHSNTGLDAFTLTEGGPSRTFAIWDAGGNDTIDMSLYGNLQIIDLREEQYSSTGPDYYNIAIARGAVIENAIGGSGVDTIYGNETNNSLYGNAGNDTIYGFGSRDFLYGGPGQDYLDGGAGSDLVSYESEGAVQVQLLDGNDQGYGKVTTGGGVEADTLVSIEDVNGSAFDDTIAGNNDGNSFIGYGGDDQFFGSGGDDVISGGFGNDTFDGGTGQDIMYGDEDIDLVTYASETAGISADFLQEPTAGKVSTATGIDTLVDIENIKGSTFADTILADNLANVIDGGGGNDTLQGRGGDDTYITDGGDTITEAAGGGTDTVVASLNYTLGAELENLVLTGPAVNGTGNALANVITGNAAANILSGEAGVDSLNGGDGNDTLIGGTEQDIFEGGKGADRLEGGDGSDQVQYTFAAAGVRVDLLNPGTNTGEAAGDTFFSIEQIRGTTFDDLLYGDDGANAIGGWSSGNDKLYGRGGNDTLASSFGADFLDGGTGADTMTGGGGNDTYYVDNAGDVVNEFFFGGTDTIQASASHVLESEVENLVLAGPGSLNGTGNILNNRMTGNGGANRLDGAGGADTLIGGLGNDTYVTDGGDIITEESNAGTDTVESWVNYTLGDNVEHLTLIGVAAINGSGNTGANRITGNGAANTLNGRGGADTLIGGLGDDTYVTDGGDTVTEGVEGGTDLVQSSVTYTLGANLENLTLTGVDAIKGTGNTLANRITGNSAANMLDGKVGADTLAGGGGNDTYVTDGLDTITEGADGGTDTVQSAVDYTLGANLENLTLIGNGAPDGTGNSLANRIFGNDAANTLDGKGGADTLSGGLGNDTYITDGLDTIVEAADGGTDTVQSSLTYTLGGNLENLVLTGNAAVNGTGNVLANRITGNGNANILDGKAGVDTLVGGGGNDTYITDGNDTITETANSGTDTVQSTASYTLGINVENLVLLNNAAIDGTGNTLANTITGNGNANKLNGGTGNDTMTGGGGADTFIFNTALNATTNRDTVADFNAAQDTIWLENAIFTAFSSVASNTAISAAAFWSAAGATTAHDADDNVIYDSTTGALFYDSDGLGGKAAIQFAVLTGAPSLTVADLVII